MNTSIVTILILIDGFLQSGPSPGLLALKQTRHNPYFNRWFSAMKESKMEIMPFAKVTILILIDGFLQ